MSQLAKAREIIRKLVFLSHSNGDLHGQEHDADCPVGSQTFDFSDYPDPDSVGCEFCEALNDAKKFSEVEYGMLAWIANDPGDLVDTMIPILARHPDIRLVSIERIDSPRISYIFELPKDKANEILGYEVDEDEWVN